METTKRAIHRRKRSMMVGGRWVPNDRTVVLASNGILYYFEEAVLDFQFMTTERTR